MLRERALKFVLVLVGLLCVAMIYPIADSLWHAQRASYSDDMMLSLYVALVVFLLMSVRNPSAHRSLIAYAAWANLAHATVMTVMAFQTTGGDRRDYAFAVAMFGIIGVVLAALTPAKPSSERASTAGA
jgi:Family of unknown function (DUF6632)